MPTVEWISVRERSGLLRWVLEAQDGDDDGMFRWCLYLGEEYLGQISVGRHTYRIFACKFRFYGQHLYRTTRLPADVLVQVVKAQLGLVRA